MALIDEAGIFSKNQAITASAASSNSIDFGAAGTPVGNAGAYVGDLGLSDIEILVQVTEDFATLTSLMVSVQTDSSSGFGTAVTIARSEVIPVATLKAGYIFRVPAKIPQGATSRYIQLYYTVAGSNATTGKIYAAIAAGRPAAIKSL